MLQLAENEDTAFLHLLEQQLAKVGSDIAAGLGTVNDRLQYLEAASAEARSAAAVSAALRSSQNEVDEMRQRADAAEVEVQMLQQQLQEVLQAANAEQWPEAHLAPARDATWPQPEQVVPTSWREPPGLQKGEAWADAAWDGDQAQNGQDQEAAVWCHPLKANGLGSWPSDTQHQVEAAWVQLEAEKANGQQWETWEQAKAAWEAEHSGPLRPQASWSSSDQAGALCTLLQKQRAQQRQKKLLEKQQMLLKQLSAQPAGPLPRSADGAAADATLAEPPVPAPESAEPKGPAKRLLNKPLKPSSAEEKQALASPMDELREALVNRRSARAMQLVQAPLLPGINDSDASGNTVLHQAIESRFPAVAEAILKRPDFRAINAKNKWGDTALHLAAAHGMLPVCEAILSREGFMELLAKDNMHDKTALQRAKSSSGGGKVIQLLQKAEKAHAMAETLKPQGDPESAGKDPGAEGE